MAKRRASGVESDEEEPTIESSPAPKRARFRDDEEGGAKRRKSAAEREDDDEDVEVEVEEADEDKKFEEKFKDKIQSSIHSGTKHQGVRASRLYRSCISMLKFAFRVWPSAE